MAFDLVPTSTHTRMHARMHVRAHGRVLGCFFFNIMAVIAYAITNYSVPGHPYTALAAYGCHQFYGTWLFCLWHMAVWSMAHGCLVYGTWRSAPWR